MILYRCPTLRVRVDALLADEPEENGNAYESVACIACGHMHLVYARSGKVLGSNDE